ncbi:polyprotein [Gossypium australe]|uniref:Polyprotein n=1 Tax=Gossypium australe TaxID=47621 RepID=A0A5B6VP93_9ROSI|nr:polyprotein [Gossypium australe]
MLRYDYSILYRKGSLNTVADALSRRSHVQEGQMFQCEISKVWSDIWNRVTSSVLMDTKLRQVIHELQQQLNVHPKYSWMEQYCEEREKWSLATIQISRWVFSTISMIVHWEATLEYMPHGTASPVYFTRRVYRRMLRTGCRMFHLSNMQGRRRSLPWSPSASTYPL